MLVVFLNITAEMQYGERFQKTLHWRTHYNEQNVLFDGAVLPREP